MFKHKVCEFPEGIYFPPFHIKIWPPRKGSPLMSKKCYWQNRYCHTNSWNGYVREESLYTSFFQRKFDFLTSLPLGTVEFSTTSLVSNVSFSTLNHMILIYFILIVAINLTVLTFLNREWIDLSRFWFQCHGCWKSNFSAQKFFRCGTLYILLIIESEYNGWSTSIWQWEALIAKRKGLKETKNSII